MILTYGVNQKECRSISAEHIRPRRIVSRLRLSLCPEPLVHSVHIGECAPTERLQEIPQQILTYRFNIWNFSTRLASRRVFIAAGRFLRADAAESKVAWCRFYKENHYVAFTPC